LILVLLALSGVISDNVAENGILIEDGFRRFALGCMLTAIGFAIIIILLLLKK
jgi:predicted cobalt transporter CbtA